jgi:hypothetical protein
MSKRFLGAALAAVLVTMVLTACSPTSNKTLSGAAARDALATVVAASMTKFQAEGGTDSISAGTNQLVLAYDPAAPEGRHVVTSNVSNLSAAAFDTKATLSLTNLQKTLETDQIKSAEIKLSANIFKITGSNFTLDVYTKDDLVASTVTSPAGSPTLIVVVTYGLSDEARKLFATAAGVTSTPSASPKV